MGFYDYYKNICICPPKPVIIGLGDASCNELDEWPVDVYNVNGVLIGNAANKVQYISIWNSNAANREVGTLYNFFGPFTFLLMVNPGQMVPFCLGGVITPGGDFLLLESGFHLLQESGSKIKI
ncbi:MAG TPA: hypothetical protein PLV31_01425 [Gammaproteobacteria bacterium]|nr:hypothetical protein [Niabella sp.]HRA42334.1 hypothetical protein [Gammaproteobacteria bacterium]HQX21663.1 hypothetical protein [Niabella sp.]HRB37104.1 hypothetical protein [Niabella sp.]HRB44160.1 hypothetical protein [Niabella sp.]